MTALAEKPRYRLRADGAVHQVASDGSLLPRVSMATPLSPMRGATAYRSASIQHTDTYNWRPSNLSADAAVLPSRELANARADDLIRNDPHAVSGVARLVDMLVGAGITLAAKPDGRALGLDVTTKTGRKKVRDLAGAMETEFRVFATDPQKRCDAQRRMSLNGTFRQQARRLARGGESMAFMAWKPEVGARYATCIRTIDPARVCNPNMMPDTPLLRGGIEFDADGVPLAYHVRNRHPGDRYFMPGPAVWERIPRTTAWGRPLFIHGFEPEMEDQARAITPFAAVASRLRMTSGRADTEMANATANALFAAFVKCSMSTDEATAALTGSTATFAESRTRHYSENPPTLQGVRIPVLGINDSIEMNAAPRAVADFAQFQAYFLQSIAAALGISYEQLSMDWSKVNYSSARAALNEVWRHIQLMFATFVEQVVCPIHYAVMEEAFDRGYIQIPAGAPGFYDAPGAYLRARWIGPGRGYVDPTKEAEAANIRIDGLMSSLITETAEQGELLEDVLDDAETVGDMLADRGLVRVTTEPAQRPATVASNDVEAAPPVSPPQQQGAPR